MATTDIEDTLFANILENLADVTNHADLAAFIDSRGARSYLVPEPFALLTRPAPYLLVVPGDEDMDEDHGYQRILPVTVYVVAQGFDLKPTDRDAGLMAISTAWRSSLIGELCKIVRDALVRVDPYNDGTHDSGVYTSQPAVTSCTATRIGPFVPIVPLQMEDEEHYEPRVHYARPVGLHYYAVEV